MIQMESVDKKLTSAEHVECTFVGNAFYRKGGRETLIAFDRLWRLGYPLKLNIVSNLSINKKGTQYHRDEQTVAETYRLLEKNRENINLMNNVPNHVVVDLFRRSHIGLLPTYFDAYGYSALEALASGCALITTNVMALSEVNDDSCGWLIDVPCDYFGHPKLKSTEELDRFSSILAQGIEASVSQAVENPRLLSMKSENALIRIRENHDPRRHAESLEKIYDEILGLM